MTKCARPLVFLLGLLLIVTPACYSWRVVRLPAQDVLDPGQERIVGITTIDDQDVRFDPLGGRIRDQLIAGTVGGLPREYGLADIRMYWVEREEIDTWRTVGVVLVAGAVIALLIVGVVEISDAETVSEIF